MRKLWTAGAGVLASGLFVATSGAVTKAPSGDTCAVNGNGTAYTVAITLGSASPEQGGFAFGAPGVKVTKVTITGTQGTGTQTTTGLPPNTTAGWQLNAAAVSGASISASLTTSGPATGSFTVVPMDARHTTYLDPLSCAFPGSTASPSNKFTVHRPFTYSAGAWHSSVTVPGAGKVTFAQKLVPSSGTVKPLVQSGKVTASGAGKVKLTLRPTAAGTAALAKSGSIKLSLTIEFSPKGGKPGNKLLALTLTK
jgi:hypothetical protein